MILDAVLSGGKRRADDFYPTPPDAVEALLRLVDFGGHRIWEPACGDGAICKVFERHGYEVVGTDLVDRGYGEGGVDFLQTTELRGEVIVTNPPFSLAADFIRHGHALQVERMAMLLKATFWSAACRLPLFRDFPPACIAPLTWRLDFTGAGSPHTDCMWVVWSTHWRQSAPVFIPVARQ